MNTFDFQRDVFDFANDVNLPFEENGEIIKRKLHHRCEGITRAWLQFWKGARFAGGNRMDLLEEKKRVARILRRHAYLPSLPEEERVVLPGYGGLREFSRAHVSWLPWLFNTSLRTHLCPGVQRMVYPFSRWGQQREAQGMGEALGRGEPIVVHASQFPNMNINHFVVCFGMEETPEGMEYQAYDPNRPSTPMALRFDKATRWFSYPKTHYCEGGRVQLNRAHGSIFWKDRWFGF